MSEQDMLSMLKIDLGISTNAYNDRLVQYIESAKRSIGIEGITLDADSVPDCDIVIQYAAWLWRKRINGEGMPRMLRWTLNNRLFSEKAGEGGSE